MMNLLYIIPKNWLSRVVGLLVNLELPQPLARISIGLFASYYKIDLSEAEKPVGEYRSIGDLFTRKLKSGVRPLGTAPILHPADSVIAQCGEISSGKIIQAKGKSYSPSELTTDPADNEKFENGVYVTYYLCPTDYHRVHTAVSGVVSKVVHVPGNLWPVNQWSVSQIEKVFCVNERVIVEQLTEFGTVKTVFVGATNVGKISLAIDSRVDSNIAGLKEKREFLYSQEVNLKAGDELGTFHMGSTIVMLYPASWKVHLKDFKSHLGKSIKVRANF